ncbi:MAG TPA: serine/threonine-protein kinase [Thermoanaerobaculia bacterium]|nr:serine/threonine-protein kinase [Thermoanaerobaculia bacterium]
MPATPAMQTIGKYEIRERIGAGGFGVVYRAYDPLIERDVALKTLATEDEGLRRRFAREARVAGNLHHPHITTIYEFGVHEELLFLVQEYLSGEDLTAKLQRRQPIPLADKLRWLGQVASGLAAAHDQGVLHRDVKPGNIRILADGDAKIMDFGIAKLLQEQTQLTRTGMTVGTVSYFSPEQVTGGAMDRRSDIFSFGLVMYELLAFAPAVPGTEIWDVMRQIAHERHRPITDPWPRCPPELAAIVDRCLEKTRERRFPDCHQLAHALERVATSGATRDSEAPAASIAVPQQASRESVSATDVTEELPGGTSANLAPPPPPPSAAAAPAPASRTPPRAPTEEPLFDAVELVAASRPQPRSGRTRVAAAPKAPWWNERRPLAILALLVLLVAGGLVAAWWQRRSGGEEAQAATRGGAAREEAAAGLRGAAAQPRPAPPASPAEGTATEPRAPGAGAVAPPVPAVLPATAMEEGVSAPVPPAPAAAAAAGGAPAPSDGDAALRTPELAVLELAPGWSPRITAAVDGAPPLPLEATATLELPAGRHEVVFALAGRAFEQRAAVPIELQAGERRTVEPAIARPSLLAVQAALGMPQAAVRVDGAELGRSPQHKWLAPGRYSVTIGEGATAATIAVDIGSDQMAIVTFDPTGASPPSVLTRRRADSDPAWDDADDLGEVDDDLVGDEP